MIKAILVDDERLALDKLAKTLEESGMVKVTGMYENPAEALEAVTNGLLDVVFLDIEMPDINGLVLADKILEIDSRVAVVFVTAYNEYAIEAFELNALDYLLKPVRRERLQKSLERIAKQRRVLVKRNNVRVVCFGRFSVLAESDEGSEIKWRTAKAEELFAFLVHHAGQPVSRDKIIDSLWEDLDAERAVAHFHTTMHYIRKNLSNSGIEGLIQHDKGFYKVDIDKIDCDFYEFDRLALTTASPIAAGSIRFFENVVSMYRGGYLEGHSYPWAEQMSRSVEEKYVGLLLQLHDWYLREGHFPTGAEILKKALKCDPLNEEIHAKLIHVYLRMNNQIAAMKQYDALRRKLKATYGVEPREAVKRLMGVK